MSPTFFTSAMRASSSRRKRCACNQIVDARLNDDDVWLELNDVCYRIDTASGPSSRLRCRERSVPRQGSRVSDPNPQCANHQKRRLVRQLFAGYARVFVGEAMYINGNQSNRLDMQGRGVARKAIPADRNDQRSRTSEPQGAPSMKDEFGSLDSPRRCVTVSSSSAICISQSVVRPGLTSACKSSI